MSSSQPSRIEELHTTIAARLIKVCHDWPLERFEAMVRNLASITLKYERQLLPNDLSSSTEELLQQMKALRQRSADHRRRGGSFPDLSAAS